MHLHGKMANKFFLPHKTQKIPYFTDNLAFALAVAYSSSCNSYGAVKEGCWNNIKSFAKKSNILYWGTAHFYVFSMKIPSPWSKKIGSK